MDIRSHILRFRKEQRQNPPNRSLRRFGTIIALAFSLSGAILVILGVFWYARVTGDLPSPDMLEVLFDDQVGTLLEPTKIFDKSGEIELWRFENPVIEYRRNPHLTDGEILFYTDVPEELVSAALTAFDPDYLSRSDRFLDNFLSNRKDPIPVNLVKDLLLWDEADHPYYQIRIKLLADQIVGRYGRLKVLEWSLNSAYFGNQVYGIDQAALIYFGKDLSNLDLAESALLAAVAKYPSLNPYDAPAAAKENQEAILAEMVSAGLISKERARRAVNQDLAFTDPEDSINLHIPSFVRYILDETDGLVPRDRVLRGGFTIVSTLDSELQQVLDCTAEIAIGRYYGDDPVLDGSCPAAKLLPRYGGPQLTEQENLEISLVLLDPQKGELLALVEGGRNGVSGRTLDAKASGSIITPYIYLNSFAQGFEPASLVWDIPLPEGELNPADLHPGCETDCEFFGPVNMRTALASDYLSPAFQLWESAGITRLNNTLTLFGYSISDESCLDCDLIYESPLLNIVDVAQGYGVFANQGILTGRLVGEFNSTVQPISISRLEDLSNNTWIGFHDSIDKTVISEGLSYLVNHALSDEDAREGIPGRDLYRIGRQTGIKVGYVPGSASGWTVGYTPQMVAVAWAGNLSAEGEESIVDYQRISADIWRASFQFANQSSEIDDWQPPEEIISLEVCHPSGMLPTENCPRVVREPFIEGNQPQEVDSLYQILEINRETGLLASVFSPVEQIEERVYIKIPAFAELWAAEVGIPMPPAVHDLENLEAERDDLLITHPENFSFVRGRVRISGSLPEEDFQSARLQFGQGMNPGSWLQIGPEITSPVSNHLLSYWDTGGLEDGIYALQLVLVSQGQQIDKVSLVVSVDNTPPEFSLSPFFINEEISFETGKELLFQAEFINPSEIESVSFYINSELTSTREISPYLYSWPLTLGDFELWVVARDQAGNQAEQTISFSVFQP